MEVKRVAQIPYSIEPGANPDKPPRGLAAVVNPVIYYLRTKFRRLEIIPTELPPLVCMFRWFLKGFRQLWLRAVLLPAAERLRPTDHDADLFRMAMPTVAGFKLCIVPERDLNRVPAFQVEECSECVSFQGSKRRIIGVRPNANYDISGYC